jgi:hypothetical protein
MYKSVKRRLTVVSSVVATSAAVVIGVMAQASAAPARPAAGSPRASAASVPWRHIGAGWALAEYSANTGGPSGGTVPVKHGPLTLYVVNPAGARYKLMTWSARSPEQGWTLVAWSGDGERALFTAPGTRQHVYQVNLQTGKVTSFTTAANVLVLGYTRPSGLNILAQLGVIGGSGNATLLRYSLTGVLQKRLAFVRFAGGVAYQANGNDLAAGYLHGLKVISNAGGVIRTLPVPAVNDGCNAVRWWDADTILASCTGSTTSGARLWLVPADGKPSSTLTPLPRGSVGGYFNAWQVSSGLYVNGHYGCGGSQIWRQSPSRREAAVTVPGAAYSQIVTATSSELMVDRYTSCGTPAASLVWFNPATKVLQVAIPDVDSQWGVTAAIPYFVTGKY